MRGKDKWFATKFQYALSMAYNKNKPYKTLDYCSRDMLNFNFLEKALGLVFTPHFEYDFSGKLFLIVSHLLTVFLHD